MVSNNEAELKATMIFHHFLYLKASFLRVSFPLFETLGCKGTFSHKQRQCPLNASRVYLILGQRERL